MVFAFFFINKEACKYSFDNKYNKISYHHNNKNDITLIRETVTASDSAKTATSASPVLSCVINTSLLSFLLSLGVIGVRIIQYLYNMIEI